MKKHTENCNWFTKNDLTHIFCCNCQCHPKEKSNPMKKSKTKENLIVDAICMGLTRGEAKNSYYVNHPQECISLFKLFSLLLTTKKKKL